MGYKHKATMYYSDEETVQFLNEHAHKRNGKKSVSHYLYSLVTKEREKAISTEIKSKPSPVTLYPEHYPLELMIDGDIEFTSLDNIRAAKDIVDINKKPIHNNIMNEINSKIEQFIAKNLRDNPRCHIKNDYFIVIRSHIIINSHHTHTTSEYCKGHFIATCMIINVRQNERGVFSSNFDFKKVKYYKYNDITKANRYIPSSLCKIAEINPQDPTGAFFIPVMNVDRPLSPTFEPGRIHITGVDIHHNKYRVKIKQSNKTQKNRYSLRERNFK